MLKIFNSLLELSFKGGYSHLKEGNVGTNSMLHHLLSILACDHMNVNNEMTINVGDV